MIISLNRSVFAALLTVVAATAAHAGAAEGKALYDEKCQVCHSLGGQGGKMANVGGALDDVGTKRDAAWLEKYLRDPKAAMPNAKMPKMKLDDAQLADVIAYMLTLKGPAPAK